MLTSAAARRRATVNGVRRASSTKTTTKDFSPQSIATIGLAEKGEENEACENLAKKEAARATPTYMLLAPMHVRAGAVLIVAVSMQLLNVKSRQWTEINVHAGSATKLATSAQIVRPRRRRSKRLSNKTRTKGVHSSHGTSTTQRTMLMCTDSRQ